MKTRVLVARKSTSGKPNPRRTIARGSTPGLKKDSAIHKRFYKCDGWRHINGLLSIGEEEIDVQERQITTVRENTKIIRRADHWQTLAFKESLSIKDRKPSLNHGIKAAKSIACFDVRLAAN